MDRKKLDGKRTAAVVILGKMWSPVEKLQGLVNSIKTQGVVHE